MPYKNIVFAKLEKRLLNDPRWFMLSDDAQLIYVKLILYACETYNRIPLNPTAIKMALRLHQTPQEIEQIINDIKTNFPKFTENSYCYYFKDFKTKTNYRSSKGKPRENPGESLGVARVGTDKEKEKEKEKEKDIPRKQRYAEFVYLTPEEHQKLTDKFGAAVLMEKIESLNNYIGSRGRKYKSHYHTILSWSNKDTGTGKRRVSVNG